jgi:hypothetical protein
MFAWQRAEDLKNDGNYSEAVQLGEWITKLQPRFSQVWEFVSWNQAYNISVGTHTPDERWFWVKSGIDLLQRRGGGLDANPTAIRLYQQLAWIYHHKIGMFQDQYNWFYKRQLANIWNAILGESPRDDAAYENFLAPLVAAPTDEADLPDGSQRLIKHMRDAGYDSPLEMLQAYTVEDQPIFKDEEGNVADQTQEPDPNAVFTVADFEARETFPDWATQDEIDATLAFLRRAAIESDQINMEVEAMVRDADVFGTIDWRHPAAHALYWSQRGLEQLASDEGRSAEGRSNVRRQMLNSLDQLARQGRVVIDPLEGYVSYTPDWPYWEKFLNFFDELLQAEDAGPDAESREARIERLYGSGFRNRMDAAIADAELYGDTEAARNLMENMRDRYAGTRFEQRYLKTLDEFLELQFKETLDNPDAARAAMNALLIQAVASRYLVRDEERYEVLLERAQRLHEGWRRNNPDPNSPLYQEVPDFPALLLEAIGSFLIGKSGDVITSQVPLTLRSQVWRSLPFQAQADLLRSSFGPQMFQQVAATGIEFERVFPLPPGLRDRDSDFDKNVTREEQLEEQGGDTKPRAEQEIK